MKKGDMTDELRLRVIELYKQGLRSSAVGLELGMTKGTVVRVLHQAGVDLVLGRGKTDLQRWNNYAVKAGEDECWSWKGHIDPYGYGMFHKRNPDGKSFTKMMAYRWAYEHFVGPIPDGLQAHHVCYNRGCVNPKHIRAVTPRENVTDSPNTVSGIAVRKTVCKWGHVFTLENTLWRQGKYGPTRACRTCIKIGSRKRFLREFKRAWPNPNTFLVNGSCSGGEND